MMTPPEIIVPDSEYRRIVARLPTTVRDLVQLARFDRLIGAWLLFWPGAWAILLAGDMIHHIGLILLFALGSVVMRGAGCVYNDIVDRDLDQKVERTRARPVASGRISLRIAWVWLVVLCLIGLAVLLQLGRVAQIAALLSLAPVAAYPYMKRITWWPQAWLGIVFSWAALVGWPAVTGGFAEPLWWLYGGAIAWVIGYDTIYALQDIEDDALAGVKSSARALGDQAKAGIGVFYGLALLCWGRALWIERPEPLALAALVPMAAHLGWQVVTLRRDDPANALHRFRSNRFAGLLIALACLVIGATSS